MPTACEPSRSNRTGERDLILFLVFKNKNAPFTPFLLFDLGVLSGEGYDPDSSARRLTVSES